MEIFFDTEYKIIQYDESNHILIGSWKLSPTSQEYRTGMMAMIDAMKKYNTGRLVYDTTNFGIILEDDQKWSVGEWREKAVAVGHSKVGFVMSKDIFSKMSGENMMDMTDDKVSFGYFLRMEDAIRWVVIPQQNKEAGAHTINEEQNNNTIL
ncbi:MAG TPA: hypothetical protein VIM75_22045 [Ohtaekwangia sp.]|uniref:hypothetical protein n=1 Tax=Ohtaekwangia sp. TaxID=2066019 RepID=UPI002F94BE52